MPNSCIDAHLYLLRRILHDFYSPVCIDILKNVAGAMGPSSRLIIADMVMPEKAEIGMEVTPFWMDFNRMLLQRLPRFGLVLFTCLIAAVL